MVSTATKDTKLVEYRSEVYYKLLKDGWAVIMHAKPGVVLMWKAEVKKAV